MGNLFVQALNTFAHGFRIARQGKDQHVAEGGADAAAAPAERCELRSVEPKLLSDARDDAVGQAGDGVRRLIARCDAGATRGNDQSGATFLLDIENFLCQRRRLVGNDISIGDRGAETFEQCLRDWRGFVFIDAGRGAIAERDNGNGDAL